MRQLRLLLLPFSLLYGLVISIRNKLYDLRFLKSYEIPVKSIVVGNLSVGGTGKSPLVDAIISMGLYSDLRIATLSRGYGRSTKGLQVADQNSTSSTIGDEPMIYFDHYGEKINVIVCEDRTKGIQFIEKNYPNTDLILLDDAFQHRKVKAGLNIVVSDYNHPYYNDLLLPAGNLREPRSGIKRADLLLISKCPDSISEKEMDSIRHKVQLTSDQVFFSSIRYKELVSINNQPMNDSKKALLVTGIGNPTPLIDHLSKEFEVDHLNFRDHHDYTLEDMGKIHKKFNTFAGRYSCVITTEKDFMRLRKFEEIRTSEIPWFYQTIEPDIIDKERFQKKILDYVDKN